MCFCNFVDEKEIVSFLKKGTTTTGEIQQLTRAGTSCGRCLPVIDGIVNTYLSELPSVGKGKLTKPQG